LRNEISPRQGPIRLREFDMMELELFYDPEDPSCPYLHQALDVEIRIIPEGEILKGNHQGVVVTIKEAMERGYIPKGWMAYFISLSQRFLEELGIPRERQRFREKLSGEKAHYAEKTFDHEVLLTTWDWTEVAGHADRTDYDLRAHIRHSQADLTAERMLKKPRVETRTIIRPKIEEIKRVFGEDANRILSLISRMEIEDVKTALEGRGYLEVDDLQLVKDLFQVEVVEERSHVERFIPHVVEPSFGLDRICYAALEYAYREKGDRVILSLPAHIAPMDAAVFPIVAKGEMVEKADHLRSQLSKAGYRVVFEVKDSIGRRYARADEIGVPVAFTIDGQTLKDNTVTARDRDSWAQVRIGMDRCMELLSVLRSLGRFEEAVASISLGRVR
jgi:glycyl-tRNA synthetase